MNVVVLVPRRADHGRRDNIWRWVSARWAELHPEWQVYEGHHDQGPFNRSAAINHAAKKAHRWDVAIVADADCLVGADQLRRAVATADESGQMTLAFNRYAFLNRAMSDQIMNGYAGDWWPGVEFTMTDTCSQMVCVRRSLWDEAGGFDEGFVGWGGEDIGFSLACQTFGGGLQRTPGEVWHLHHPSAPHTHDDVWPARMRRYEACDYNPEKMRALLAELGVK